MILGITGSRKFDDMAAIEAVIADIKPTMVIAGGCAGADKMAVGIAKKAGIPVKEFLPRFKTDPNTPYHPKWYLERNKEIVDSCDLLAAFFAGTKSKGTKYTVDYATKTGKPVKIYPETMPQKQASLF